MITAVRKRYLELLVALSLLGFVVLAVTGNLNPYAIPDLVLFVVLVVMLAKKWSATGDPESRTAASETENPGGETPEG